MICKKIILIRHAESTNNASKRTFSRTFGSFHLPSTWHQVWQVASLAALPMDSALTADGLCMIERQRDAFQQVMKSSGTTTIIHSHLQRARHTAQGLCTGWSDASLEESPALYEKSLAEYARVRSFPDRVDEFKRSLASRSEERIALVGHSGFFRKLVPQMQERRLDVGNVSVWTAELLLDGSWQNVQLLLPGWLNGLEQWDPVAHAEAGVGA